MSEVGELLLGRYKITEALARGGFGVVYKGEAVHTGEAVAIKRLLTDDEGQLQRFDREMMLTSKLNSPHTVRLLDHGKHNDNPIMVLEFVDGETLQDRIKRGPMKPEEARLIIRQVLESLAEAHGHGIVHRDLKPPNIMLVGEGMETHAKLLDFGTAGVESGHETSDHKKITKFGEIQGTPSYMAPEQILEFGNACTQSDLYSMGLMFFECLVGDRPFKGSNSLEICTLQVQQPLPVPPALEQSPFLSLIVKAASKQVADRFQTAEAMIAALKAVDLSAPSTARTMASAPAAKRQPVEQASSKMDPKLLVLILILIVVVILVVLLAMR